MSAFEHTSRGMPRFVNALALILFLTLIAACGSAPTRPEPTRPAASAADRAYQQGRFLQAYQLYEQEAERSPDNRDRLLLRAADAAYQANAPEISRQLLQGIDDFRLNIPEQALGRLLMAATSTDRAAHRLLSSLDETEDLIPQEYRPLLHRLRAQAYLDAGQAYRSALERIALSRWLLDSDAREANQEAMLDALQQLSARQAQAAMKRHGPDDEIFAWLALVEMLKSQVFEGQPVASVIATWRSRFPDHPASSESIEQLLHNYDLAFEQPGRIALLLPLSGRIPQSARAIRDGFLSAYYADAQRRSEIVIYDTGDSVDQAMAQYRKALADGATQVVGPLQREAVTALVLEADGATPVLALNYQDGTAPAAPSVYQFGLLPEQEARAVAERMMADGHWRSVTLNPRSPLGDRLEAAFIEHFEQLGGTVLGSYRYSETENDFSSVIQQAVGVTEARLRERRLQRIVDLPLSFEPPRRHDVDAIFIGARAPQARLIKPQLAFYNAGDLPAYATSHVYGGRPAPEDDQDLNGLKFCDSPWLLGSQSFRPSVEEVRTAFAEARSSAIRLFAVGVDAYRLLPYLDWLGRYRGDSFPGATGELRMDNQGRIRRSLDCGTFRQGIVEFDPSPLPPVSG